MTSREIVQRAIAFQNPPRLPVNLGSVGFTDMKWCSTRRAESFVPRVPGEDEWGCVWAHTDMQNMGQVKGHPLEDLSRMDAMQMPDYTDPSHYAGFEDDLRQAEAAGKYAVSGIFMVLFERMHTLHGFENSLVDLYEDRPAMEALADRIADTHITLVREVAKRFPGRLDGWSMSDDWGTQQAAYISFDLWMDFFFPRYKRIFDAMHEAGSTVWVHSCGKVNEIIEGYIQAGVDVVNLQQPRALGIEEIGNRYRGRITFETLADIQVSLPSGKRQYVAEDAESLGAHWMDPRGGFILSDYGDNAAIGVTDPGMKRYMYEVFSEQSAKIYGAPLPTLGEQG